MKNTILKKSVFVLVVILSISSFLFLQAQGMSQDSIAQAVETAANNDLAANSLSDISLLKSLFVKVIDIITLQF